MVNQKIDDENGAPCWNIVCETIQVVTPRILISSLSEKLNPNLKFIDPRLKIKPLFELEKLDNEKRISFPDSDWYPGYVTSTIVQVSQLLKNEEILKAIEERPEKFSTIALRRQKKTKDFEIKF